MKVDCQREQSLLMSVANSYIAGSHRINLDCLGAFAASGPDRANRAQVQAFCECRVNGGWCRIRIDEHVVRPCATQINGNNDFVVHVYESDFCRPRHRRGCLWLRCVRRKSWQRHAGKESSREGDR
jgi:hypothetical protein